MDVLEYGFLIDMSYCDRLGRNTKTNVYAFVYFGRKDMIDKWKMNETLIDKNETNWKMHKKEECIDKTHWIACVPPKKMSTAFSRVLFPFYNVNSL